MTIAHAVDRGMTRKKPGHMLWAVDMFPIRIEIQPRHTLSTLTTGTLKYTLYILTTCKLYLCKNVCDYNLKILLNVLSIFQLGEVWWYNFFDS